MWTARFVAVTLALLAAASFNLNPEIVRVLTAAGAEVNTPIDGGGTALMSAAGLNPNPAVTQALIDAGADLMARTDEGETPLMSAAAFTRNPVVIQVLLGAGADLHSPRRHRLDHPHVGSRVTIRVRR